jgi:hypothetical protein
LGFKVIVGSRQRAIGKISIGKKQLTKSSSQKAVVKISVDKKQLAIKINFTIFQNDSTQ